MYIYDYIKKTLWLWIALCMWVAGCQRFRPLEQVDPLPDLEIVFQTTASENDSGGCSLGFTDADGNVMANLILPPMRSLPPVYPAWTSDQAMIVFGSLHTPKYLHTILADGRIFRYDYDYGKLFSSHSRSVPVRGTHQVVFATYDNAGSIDKLTMSIHRGDLDTREIVQTYVHLEPIGGKGIELEVGTNPMHNQLLVYRRSVLEKQEILILDTTTGQETVLMTAGIKEFLGSPAFSPDGASVAYMADDGLYVLSVPAEDAQPQRIIELPNSTARSQRWPAAPSWSPDGQWLVYHRCSEDCSYRFTGVESFDIFKVNVETGEEVLLVEGGLNPYWRQNAP